MSEMVERVARAIWTMRAESFPHDSFDDLPEHEKKMARIYARHAIEAMREPTEPMNEAGSGFVQSEFAWEAMIDAALKDD